MLYSKALLHATYCNGRPGGRLTEQHEKAEHHRFKTEFLFKEKQIPKDLYVSRLIQHFLILKVIEEQLLDLSQDSKAEINAFFSISYLEHLWRTPGMQRDLRLLDVDVKNIDAAQIAQSTTVYMDEIKKLPPKELLAHFLLHVAGFMHGGTIIRTKYIEPSNSEAMYQIPTNQYDFSQAAEAIAKKTSLNVYHDMIAKIDAISLDEYEYAGVLQQGMSVYETMSKIYDDLCIMHANHPKSNSFPLAAVCVSIVVIGAILKMLFDLFSPNLSSVYGPK